LAYLQRLTMRQSATDPTVALWQVQVRPYQPLIERIIAQSERRVLAASRCRPGTG
jgi:IS5 family transposase